MSNILILNSGGTFNKIYNKLNGQFDIDSSNIALREILDTFYNLKYELKNIVLKDSIYMTDSDRLEVLKAINDSKCKYCILIHGTDTMELTAKFLEENGTNKTVILTGAMVPYSICKTEAATNFALSVGFLLNNPSKDIFIGMHGAVKNYKKITKNRKIGQFELI